MEAVRYKKIFHISHFLTFKMLLTAKAVPENPKITASILTSRIMLYMKFFYFENTPENTFQYSVYYSPAFQQPEISISLRLMKSTGFPLGFYQRLLQLPQGLTGRWRITVFYCYNKSHLRFRLPFDRMNFPKHSVCRPNFLPYTRGYWLSNRIYYCRC